eukprot:gene9227-16372_t
MASSTYFGPLVCTTQQTTASVEAFLWEQLLGTSGSKRWEELVAEMIQVVQIGEEWTQAVPMVTLDVQLNPLFETAAASYGCKLF